MSSKVKCPACGIEMVEQTEIVEREVVGSDGKPTKKKVIRRYVECPVHTS